MIFLFAVLFVKSFRSLRKFFRWPDRGRSPGGFMTVRVSEIASKNKPIRVAGNYPTGKHLRSIFGDSGSEGVRQSLRFCEIWLQDLWILRCGKPNRLLSPRRGNYAATPRGRSSVRIVKAA